MGIEEIFERSSYDDFKKVPLHDSCECFKNLLGNECIVIYDHNGKLLQLRAKISKIFPIKVVKSDDKKTIDEIEGLVKTIVPPKRKY